MELNESFESQINRSDYKILIVDDVVSNVLLLKILLTNEKFQVCTANCGNACIEQAKAEKLYLCNQPLHWLLSKPIAIAITAVQTFNLFSAAVHLPSFVPLFYDLNPLKCK